MRRCPACSRVYDDLALKFCLDDGTELVMKAPDGDEPATEVMRGPENNPPETIEAPTPLVDSPSPEIPATVAAPRGGGGGMIPIIVIAAVLLIVGAIVLALAAVVPPSEGFPSFFLTRLSRRLPMLLLALGGIAIAVIRWRSHPRASIMTAVALGVYLVDFVVYTAILNWLPVVEEAMGLSGSASRWFHSVIYFIEDIVVAVTIILLVAAAFADRKTTKFDEQ